MRPEVRHVIMRRMKNDYRDNDYNYDEHDSRRDYDAILIGGIILS